MITFIYLKDHWLSLRIGGEKNQMWGDQLEDYGIGLAERCRLGKNEAKQFESYQETQWTKLVNCVKRWLHISL